MCRMCMKSRNNDADNISVCSDDEYDDAYDNRRSCLCKCVLYICIIILSLLIIAFIVIFVVLPLIFMSTLSWQTFLMFPNILQPDNPEYENYALYDIKGVYNRYLTVDDYYDPRVKLTLGAWQIVPEDEIQLTLRPDFPGYDNLLWYSQKPIIIYFHGNSGTRIYPHNTYRVLRKYFHIIAFDYRSYGDSTPGRLTEKAVVNDAVQVYKEIQSRTQQPKIYVWGHSLGTALSTHTLRLLSYDNIFPMGLILEAPFTEMAEEILHHPLGKIFSWLPWFHATVIQPLQDNGFHFKTVDNIRSVQCPIMIIHAEDDDVIPYELGKKLANIAISFEKNVTYHQIPENARANHMNIWRYGLVPQYIEKFIEIAESKNKITRFSNTIK